MSGILHAWSGAMLVCVPVSLALATMAYHVPSENPKPLNFMVMWMVSYFVTVLAAAAIFVGGIGVMLLVGAFR